MEGQIGTDSEGVGIVLQTDVAKPGQLKAQFMMAPSWGNPLFDALN